MLPLKVGRLTVPATSLTIGRHHRDVLQEKLEEFTELLQRRKAQLEQESGRTDPEDGSRPAEAEADVRSRLQRELDTMRRLCQQRLDYLFHKFEREWQLNPTEKAPLNGYAFLCLAVGSINTTSCYYARVRDRRCEEQIVNEWRASSGIVLPITYRLRFAYSVDEHARLCGHNSFAPSWRAILAREASDPFTSMVALARTPSQNREEESGQTRPASIPRRVACSSGYDMNSAVAANPFPLPKSGAEAVYLGEQLGDALGRALAEICVHRPTDPIEYLGLWLKKYSDNVRQQQEEAIISLKLRLSEEEALLVKKQQELMAREREQIKEDEERRRRIFLEQAKQIEGTKDRQKPQTATPQSDHRENVSNATKRVTVLEPEADANLYTIAEKESVSGVSDDVDSPRP